MVNIAGFGQDISEIIDVLSALLVLASVAMVLATGNWNVVWHGYNILNTIFFSKGAAINAQTCSQMFNGFNVIQVSGATNDASALSVLFGQVMNTAIILFNIIIGLLVFIIFAIVGCGPGAIIMLIGWVIALNIVYKFVKFMYYFNSR